MNAAVAELVEGARIKPEGEAAQEAAGTAAAAAEVAAVTAAALAAEGEANPDDVSDYELNDEDDDGLGSKGSSEDTEDGYERRLDGNGVMITERILGVNEFKALYRTNLARAEATGTAPQRAPTRPSSAYPRAYARQAFAEHTDESSNSRRSPNVSSTQRGNSHVNRMFSVLSSPVPRQPATSRPRGSGRAIAKRKANQGSTYQGESSRKRSSTTVPSEATNCFMSQLDMMRKRKIPERAKQDYETLYLENMRLREKVAALETAAHTNKGKMEQMKAHEHKLEKKLADLQHTAAKGGDFAVERRGEVKHPDPSIVNRLKAKVRSLKAELDEKSGELEKLKQDGRYMRIRELEVEVKAYYTESKRLQSILDQMIEAKNTESDRQAMNEALNLLHDKEQAILKLREKMTMHKQHAKRNKVEMETALNNHGKMETERACQLEDAQMKLTDAQETVELSKRQLMENELKLKAIESQCDFFEDEAKRCQNVISSLRKANEELKSEYNEILTQHQQVNLQNTSLNTQYSELQQDLHEAREKKHRAKEELEKLEMQMEGTERERESMKEEQALLRKELDRAKEDYQNLLRDHREATADVTASRLAMRNMEQDLEEERNKSKTLSLRYEGSEAGLKENIRTTRAEYEEKISRMERHYAEEAEKQIRHFEKQKAKWREESNATLLKYKRPRSRTPDHKDHRENERRGSRHKQSDSSGDSAKNAYPPSSRNQRGFIHERERERSSSQHPSWVPSGESEEEERRPDRRGKSKSRSPSPRAERSRSRSRTLLRPKSPSASRLKSPSRERTPPRRDLSTDRRSVRTSDADTDVDLDGISSRSRTPSRGRGRYSDDEDDYSRSPSPEPRDDTDLSRSRTRSSRHGSAGSTRASHGRSRTPSDYSDDLSRSRSRSLGSITESR